jgi:UDP-glucose 4-epimerase
MKVLITGGAGFIGSHLVEKYLARGDQVAVIDDFSTGSKKNIADAMKSNVTVYEMKLQSPEIAEVVRREKPDLINHHCAQKSVRDSVTDPKKDADINLIALLNLMEAVRQTDCRKIIYASSGGVVYGEQSEFPATEEHPKNPMSPYGVTKYASELYLNYYVQQFDFHATCLRYGNVYGPRQDPAGEAGVVAIFSERMKAGKETVIYGTGKQTRDFVFVGDIANANIAAEKTLNGFHAYNVGRAVEVSITEIHDLLARAAGHKTPVKFEAAKPGEQMRSVLSHQALSKATGWQPETSLETGLRKTYEWFLNH